MLSQTGACVVVCLLFIASGLVVTGLCLPVGRRLMASLLALTLVVALFTWLGMFTGLLYVLRQRHLYALPPELRGGFVLMLISVVPGSLAVAAYAIWAGYSLRLRDRRRSALPGSG